jgi:uncharacterized cupin superfamily protein
MRHNAPMSDPSVFAADWDQERPAAFRARMTRVGERAGARELGATVYELDPGGAVSPYHLHHGNEELLVVVEGTPELRTADGLRTLTPGAVVAFPRGPHGAHQLRNRSAVKTRVLLVSTMHHPDVAEYPDTGATLAVTEPAKGKAFPGERGVPFMDAALAALHADDQP